VGASDYIPKSINAAELVGAIGQWLPGGDDQHRIANPTLTAALTSTGAAPRSCDRSVPSRKTTMRPCRQRPLPTLGCARSSAARDQSRLALRRAGHRDDRTFAGPRRFMYFSSARDGNDGWAQPGVAPRRPVCRAPSGAVASQTVRSAAHNASYWCSRARAYGGRRPRLPRPPGRVRHSGQFRTSRAPGRTVANEHRPSVHQSLQLLTER
jgi:hypothetical protein